MLAEKPPGAFHDTMIHATNQIGDAPRAEHEVPAAVLAVPGAFMRPAASFNLFTTSIFKSLSIPPAAVQPPPAADAAAEPSSSLHPPVLALTLFPPFR